jgi:flagellar L-ring protein precursor FlgH
MNANVFSSLFSDHKSFAVGDILTVHISESSRATSSSQSRTNRQMDQAMNINAGQGALNFIPLTGMGNSASNNFRGDANTTRDASLTSRMTVRIVDIDVNGNLIIEGSRVVTINGEEETTTLKGIVRSQDVGSDNTVSSHNIADAQISYTGKGAINEASRPGLFTRVFNYLF